MPAQAWKLYNLAKKKLGNGTLNLSATTWRIALVKSTSNFTTATLSLFSSINNEVASGNGYSSSGKGLATEAWTVSATASAKAGTWKFDADDVIFSASGGNIGSIFGAVIYASGATPHLLAYASLTSSAFTLNDGSTLTVQMNAAGIFTMY